MSQDIFVNPIEILTTDLATTISASLYTYGGISIYSTQDSTDFSSATSLLVLGGTIIEKSTIIGGITQLLNTTSSTSTTSGALVVTGGIGVSGNLYSKFSNVNNLVINNNASISNLLSTNSNITNFSCGSSNIQNLNVMGLATISNISITNSSISSLSTMTFKTDISTIQNLVTSFNTMGSIFVTNSTISNGIITNISNSSLISSSISSSNLITNNANLASTVFSAYNTTGTWINLPTGLASSGIGSGGIGSNLWIGYSGSAGNWFSNSISGDICHKNNTGSLLFGTGSGSTISSTMQINNSIVTIQSTINSTTINTGALVVNGGIGLNNNLNVGGNTILNGTSTILGSLTVSGITSLLSTISSTNSSNGSVIISGGLGVNGLSNMSSINISNISNLNSLNVNGISSFNSTVVSTNSSNGSVIINGGLGINGGVFIGGITNITTLTVSGASTLSTINAGATVLTTLTAAATTLSSVTISGVSALAGITGTTLSLTGALTVGAFTANSVSTLVATSITQLTVTGVTATNILVTNLTVSSLVLTTLQAVTQNITTANIANLTTGTLNNTGNMYSNQYLTYLGGTVAKLLTPSPLVAKGDLYTYATSGINLPASTYGSALICDTSTNTGLRWSNLMTVPGNAYSEFNFSNSPGVSSTTGMVPILKTSITTGTLVGGIYAIDLSYTIAANTTTTNDNLVDVYLNINGVTSGTNGTLIHQNTNRSNQATINNPFYDSITQTIGNTAVNIGLYFYNSTAAKIAPNVNIASARIRLYRIQ